MRKELGFLLAAGLISLSACETNNEANSDSDNNEEEAVAASENNTDDESVDETEVDEEEPEEDEAIEEEDEEGFGSSVDDSGEMYEEGFGTMRTLGIGYNDEVGIDGTDAPIKPIEFGDVILSINGMAVVELEPDEEISYIFDEKEVVRAIIVDMEVENNSDQDITFHPNQATMVTSNGEQVESEMFLMGDVGGDFYGGVKKADQAWWLIDNVDDDIENIKMIIDAPYYIDDWEDIGEEKRLDFEILSWEDALERDGRN